MKAMFRLVVAHRFVLLALVIGSGCSKTAKLELGATCVLNSDCTQPLSCKFGKCHRACSQSRDCARDERCVQVEGGPICLFVQEKACGAGCPAPLTCGPDNQCRGVCAETGGCPAEQICVSNRVCAEKSEPLASVLGGGDGGQGSVGGDGGIGVDAGTADDRPPTDGSVTTGSADASGLDQGNADGNRPEAPHVRPDMGVAACGPSNTTRDQACTILPNTLVEGMITMPDSKPAYYRFAVRKGVTYTINFSNTSTAGQTEFLVSELEVNGTTTPLDRQGGCCGFAGTIYPELVPTSDGFIVLAVIPNGASSGTFRFAVIPGDEVDWDGLTFEPNNSLSTAVPVPLGVTLTADLSAPVDVIDYYRFPVNRGATYTINLVNASPNVSALFMNAWLSANGTFVRLGDYGGCCGIGGATFPEVVATASGTLVVGIWAAGGKSGAYTLEVVGSDSVKHDPTTFEPNNSPSSAAPIVFGQIVDTTLSAPADSDDYYALSVEKGHTYSIDLTSFSGSGNGNLAVTAGTGSDALVQSDFAPRQARSWEITPDVSGTALLHLRTGAAIAYKLVVRASTADGLVHDPVTFEPNNSPSTAAPIAIGTEINANVDPTSDPVDTYQVTLSAGTSYTLSSVVTAASGQLGVAAKLNGIAVVDRAVFGTMPWSKTFTPPQAGTLVITVDGPAAPTAYRLKLTSP